MKIYRTKALFTLTAFLVGTTVFAAEADMQGSHDFDGMPRVADTYIFGYGESEYDAGQFISAVEDDEIVTVSPEGKRTRIVYVGQENQSSLQMIRNYQKAFSAFGDYEEKYSCKGENCSGDIISASWNSENNVPTSTSKGVYLHQYGWFYKQPMYVYGTVVKDGKTFHVSALAVYEVETRSGITNAPVVHLEIVEEEGFESDLVFIDATAMTTEIAERGSIALYGIQFDFDSASIQARSSDTISEIAKALHADDSLSVYVVGHTDSEGNHDYNQNLSAERAASVVATLVKDHSISADRLSSVGVGQVAPVASNDTEEGRELNRRVVIVKR